MHLEMFVSAGGGKFTIHGCYAIDFLLIMQVAFLLA